MPAKQIVIKTCDSYLLVATEYSPEQPAAEQAQYIVIAGATGVPRGFYRRFAEYAASCGVHVICLDYRGIGDSKRGPLAKLKMDYADWGCRDLSMAVHYAHQMGKVWIVAHSFGGHALGLLRYPHQVQAAYVCGTGAGWHGWMPVMERIKVWTMWNLIGPILTRVLGYMPMRKLGMGEDLPLGVYRDWRRWCKFPNYFFGDTQPQTRSLLANFANVSMPIAATVSEDDRWAPPKSRDAFFAGYSAAPVEAYTLSPQEMGVKQIGHMGYFRQEIGNKLWPRIMDWLSQHGLQTHSLAHPH